MNGTAIEETYNAIRDGIFERKYKPGFHLKEEEFSEALNVSRTPVRQAIRMLADEGLVVIKDNRRSYVADVSDENIETIYDIVSMLESYSAGLAAENIDADGIARLKAIQEELESGDLDDDLRFLRANYKFHRSIHEASGSRLLKKLIGQIIHLSAICYLKAGVHTENETAIHQHNDIINALERRDRDHAALLMRVHIESVRRQYRELLKPADL